MNAIPLLLVGVYLIGVAINDNGGKLLELLAKEKAFLKWAIALWIFQSLAHRLPQSVGSPLWTSVIAAGLVYTAQTGELERATSYINKTLSEKNV